MSCLGMFRILSHGFACLSVRQGSGGNSTDRWQDKSRELRPGRSVEEGRKINDFTRGASSRASLHISQTQVQSRQCAPRAHTS
jgi:hypothetical protein